MNNCLTFKINLVKANLIYRYLKDFLTIKNNSNLLYLFKTKNYTITIYKNFTIVFQGDKYENILKMINYEQNFINDVVEDGKKNIEYGSDEVGTGDLFGGIIVCAAKITDIEKIRELNVCDSKKYNNIAINNLFKQIKDSVEYSIFELNPDEYNSLYDKYKNLNVLKTLGHYQCLDKINKNDGYAMIDQFANKKSIEEYLKKLNVCYNEKYLLETKAENKYLEVACASIIARYFFIKQINTLSKKLNYEIPFGGNNWKTKQALNFINEKNKKAFIKLNFKNAFLPNETYKIK